MNRVEAVSGATESQMASLTAQAKELGSTTQFSASQAAQGMGFLAQAGFDVVEVLAAMPDTLNLAAAGQIDLAAAADIASNVLSGFGFAADEMSRVADVMALTAASSNTSIEMMGTSFAYVGPVAAAAGQDFEMMAAMIGKLGDAGIQASSAGTALWGIIARFAKPGKEAAAVFERIGLAVNDASGQMRPLNDIMRDVGEASLSTGDQVAVFGKLAVAAGAVLSGVTEETAALAAELKNAGGAAERMAETQMKGLKGSFITLKSAVEGLLIAMGEKLAPLFTWLIERLTSMVRWMTNLPGPVKAVAAGLGVLLAALGPVVVAGGALLAAFSLIGGGLATLAPVMAAIAPVAAAMWAAITGPVGLVVIGVLAVIALFYKFRRQIGNVLSSMIQVMAIWADRMLSNAEAAFGWIPGLSGKIEGARKTLAKFSESSAEWVDGWGEANEVTQEAAVALGAVTASSRKVSVAAEGMTIAAQKSNAALADMKRRLLGLPTKETKEEFDVLRRTWATMGEDERVRATDRYKEALIRLRDAGAELNEVQTIMVDGIDSHVVALKAAQPEIIRTVEALEKTTDTLAEQPGLWEGAKAGAKQFGKDLAAVFSQQMADLVNSVATGAKSFREAIRDLGTKAGDALGAAMAQALAAVPVVGPFLQKLGPTFAAGIKKIGKSIWGGVKKLFGKGGDEANRAAVEAARKTAAAVKQVWMDTVVSMASSILGAHETAAEAGQQAYDDMYEAMIEAGWAEKTAIREAGTARQNAITAALQAQKDSYVRQAAFEAALEAIRSGNSAGAAAAARKAARETAQAWETAMGAVGLANEAANDAMQDSAEKTKDAVEETAGTVGELGAEIAGEMAGAVADVASAASGLAGTIQAELDAVKPVIDIVVNHHTEYSYEGESGPAETTGGTGQSPILARSGTGGIRDFGTRGTPARLHGREAVMTEDAIMRMVRAAAEGGQGGGGGGQDIVIQLDGAEVGRKMLGRMRGAARGRGY